MKKLFMLIIVIVIGFSAFSQTNLTTALDFTVTDVDGITHDLFDYLNDDKFVVLEFFFVN